MASSGCILRHLWGTKALDHQATKNSTYKIQKYTLFFYRNNIYSKLRLKMILENSYSWIGIPIKKRAYEAQAKA